MAKIYAPNKEYTGVSASVFFVKGVGETENPHLINWFKDKGYEVEKKENKAVEEKQDEENTVNEETPEITDEASDKEISPIEEAPKKPNKSSKK
ncbi:MAG: hypothetical protein Q4B43_05480 [Bacteroidota bacterium]|nr:hypothetical protein [Bacteroidota bacterium]